MKSNFRQVKKNKQSGKLTVMKNKIHTCKILTQCLPERYPPTSCCLKRICLELQEQTTAAALNTWRKRGTTELAKKGITGVRTIVNCQVVLGAQGGGNHIKIIEPVK